MHLHVHNTLLRLCRLSWTSCTQRRRRMITGGCREQAKGGRKRQGLVRWAMQRARLRHLIPLWRADAADGLAIWTSCGCRSPDECMSGRELHGPGGPTRTPPVDNFGRQREETESERWRDGASEGE